MGDALKDTKVGDDVLHNSGGFTARTHIRTKVVRTTATRVMIAGPRGEVAFNRSGRIVGADMYSQQSLRPWDDGFQHLVDASEAATLRDWLRGTDLRKVPLPALREAVRLLTEARDG
jgi:hypothetical protein